MAASVPPYLMQALRCILPFAWPIMCIGLAVMTIKAIDGMYITMLLPVDGFPDGHGGLEAQKQFWIQRPNTDKRHMTYRQYLVWPTVFAVGEVFISLWLRNGWMLILFGMLSLIGLVINLVVKNK